MMSVGSEVVRRGRFCEAGGYRSRQRYHVTGVDEGGFSDRTA